MERFETRPVLAAAYSQRVMDAGGPFLTHSVRLSSDNAAETPLCKRVKPEHIGDDPASGMHKEPPTCPVCLKRDPRFQLSNRFPAGTPIGVDKMGAVIHVGDVVETLWNSHCGWVRGVVVYEEKAARFFAWAPLHPQDDGGHGGFAPTRHVTVVRPYTDPPSPADLLPRGGTGYA